MFRRNKWMIGAALVLGGALPGCTDVLGLLNPDLLSSLGLGAQVANLPGDAPGLLVSVENRTNRWITAQVSYRDSDDSAQSYDATLAPGDKTATMLVCPIPEITLGDVSSLAQPGAIVYLADLTTDATGAVSVVNVPFLNVDAFGSLLRTGVNYDCGDEVLFVVQASASTQSGYQVYAYIRRSGS